MKYPDYKYVEIAIGSLTSRNVIVTVNEVESRKTDRECYRSLFRFNADIIGYVKDKGGVSEYKGLCYTDYLWIDIDRTKDGNPELQRAFDDTLYLINRLKWEYGVDPSILRVYFTGHKGFCIGVPSELFSLEPSADLPEICSQLANEIAGDIVIDDFYQTNRLFRLSNTINTKSKENNYYKIELDPVSEVLNGNLEDILQLAKNPRIEKVEHANGYLEGTLAHLVSKIPAKQIKPDEQKTKPDNDYSQMLNGEVVNEGRTATLTKLAGHWYSKGISVDEAVILGKNWDTGNNIGLDNDPQYQNQYSGTGKVEGTIRDIYRRNNQEKSASRTGIQVVSPEGTSTDKPIKPFNLTDYGNAERLVYYYGDIIRYCEPMKSWFIWDGKRWNRDTTIKIERLAKDTTRRIYAEASLCGGESVRKSIADHAKRSEAHNRIRGMVEMAKSEIEVVINPNDFDNDPYLLNCINGTLNLKTGKLQQHRKEDNITKLANVAFDHTARCPRWETFMDEIFLSNEDVIRYVQYALGYSMSGSTDEQCMFVCYGVGQNGKSKMLDTNRYIMGDYGQGVEASTFEDVKRSGGQAREDIASLKNIRFISSIETGQGHRIAESLIKQMTGDATIRARFLYQNSFEFNQTYKIWLATNHKPVIQGTDDGIWRRIRLIPFEFKVTERNKDPKLYEKLIAEAPGILNWMLEGCLAWQTCGLDIITPTKVVDATGSYRQEMDTLGTFIDECCVVDTNCKVGVTELYMAYCAWSSSRITRKTFGLRMEEKGFEKERLKIGVCFVGIGLKA